MAYVFRTLIPRSCCISSRSLCTSGVNLAYRRARQPDRRKNLDLNKDHGTFEKLFRESHFVNFGVPNGKRVVAKIIEVREEEKSLYVDFGCKFHAVVDMPLSASKKFGRGDKLVVELRDTEVVSHLQGMPKSFSILEGQAVLVRSFRQQKTPQYKPRQQTTAWDVNWSSAVSAAFQDSMLSKPQVSQSQVSQPQQQAQTNWPGPATHASGSEPDSWISTQPTSWSSPAKSPVTDDVWGAGWSEMAGVRKK